MSPQDNLDLIIAKAIKEIEHEALKGMPSPEETWKDFVTRIREQELNKGNKFHRYINIKGALIACVALLLLIAFQNKNVVAFKNELVRWIGKDNNHQTIIMEHENPEIEKGSYTNLTLAEAKEKVLFHIVEPSFLPVDINQEPDVEVEMYEYPWSLVKITYQGNNKKIITIKQENTPGHGQRNTFIPENGDLKEVTINNWDIILIEQDEALNARWVDNGIRYIITTYKISKSELIKLIESLE